MGKRSSSVAHELESSLDYALMLLPEEQRYSWSPVWVRGLLDHASTVISLPHVLEGTRCEDCREDMVLSHIEVLGQCTELARDLLAETRDRPDPRRDDLGRVLVFFGGDLAQALSWQGIDIDDDVVAMASEAIAEAVKTASICFAQSFSRQLASTL
jgi:hypothetical protein